MAGRSLLDPMPAVDDYGRTAADLQNPDFQKGQGQAILGAVPGAGIARAFGYSPQWQDGDGFVPTGGVQKGDNLLDLLRAGKYGDASLTGLGAVADLLAVGGVARALRGPSFLKSPAGTVDWGNIAPDAVAASGGKLKDVPIRIMEGAEDFGYDHMQPERLRRIQRLGFSGPDDFVDYVAKNHNMVVEQDNGRIGLVVAPGRGLERNRPANNYMAVELRPNGDHYGVTTVLPNAADSYLNSGGKTTIWQRNNALPE